MASQPVDVRKSTGEQTLETVFEEGRAKAAASGRMRPGSDRKAASCRVASEATLAPAMLTHGPIVKTSQQLSYEVLAAE